jgi:hypothetical protein
MKRSGPDMDGYGTGKDKATISYDKIDKGLRTYKKKPDPVIKTAMAARSKARVLLKGSKND